MLDIPFTIIEYKFIKKVKKHKTLALFMANKLSKQLIVTPYIF